jgi:tetratricopeptide (TPR) repeat protein
MARDDWFRNTDWNACIEEAFFKKLARARRKAQYLRIQACTIAQQQPQVALRLLEQYFLLGDHFDDAQAYVDRATAYLSLGMTQEAFKAYEDALATEQCRPNYKTSAYIVYPFTIAVRGETGLYDRGLNLLDQHKGRLTFPIERFQWHAAQALIAADQQRSADARSHARQALAHAAQDHSGLQYHPDVGLVGAGYKKVRKRLEDMC